VRTAVREDLEQLADLVAAKVVAAPRPLALTVAQACASLGCSWDFWAEHVASEVRIVRRGRRRLVPVAELERWLDENAERLLDTGKAPPGSRKGAAK
jgi:hypothetical protein